MLLEATYNFQFAYIGGTLDGLITLFQLTSSQTFIGSWDPNVDYVLGNAVAGSDGNVYVAKSSTQGVNPVGDGAVHWGLASGYDLTGYTASLVIPNAFTLTSSSGGGLTLGGTAGTIIIKATPIQTATVPNNKNLHYYLQLTDSAGDVYFPISGTINFSQP